MSLGTIYCLKLGRYHVIFYRLTFLFSGHCRILHTCHLLTETANDYRLRARMLRDEVYTHPSHAFKFGSPCRTLAVRTTSGSIKVAGFNGFLHFNQSLVLSVQYYRKTRKQTICNSKLSLLSSLPLSQLPVPFPVPTPTSLLPSLGLLFLLSALASAPRDNFDAVSLIFPRSL